jgi:uncharacterized protein involved in outer membrane biogenesis
MRQVKADYALGSLFKNEIRLSEVVVDVPRVVVVRKADGETNLQRLSGAARKKGGGGRSGAGRREAPAPAESKPAKPLRMDRVVIRHRHGGDPRLLGEGRGARHHQAGAQHRPGSTRT